MLSLPALGEWYMLTQSRSRNSVFSIRPGGSAHPGIKYYYIYVAPWRVKGNVFQIHYSLNLDPAKKLKLFPSCFLILPWNNILSSNSNKKVKSIERYIFQLALCFLNHSSLMLKKKKICANTLDLDSKNCHWSGVGNMESWFLFIRVEENSSGIT